MCHSLALTPAAGTRKKDNEGEGSYGHSPSHPDLLFAATGRPTKNDGPLVSGFLYRIVSRPARQAASLAPARRKDSSIPGLYDNCRTRLSLQFGCCFPVERCCDEPMSRSNMLPTGEVPRHPAGDEVSGGRRAVGTGAHR